MAGVLALALMLLYRSFDGAASDTGHDEPAGCNHENHRRNRGQDASGQEKSPINSVLAHGFVKLER